MPIFKVWLEAIRPKTLPASAVPVLLGSSLAWADDVFQWAPALICLTFAFFMQVGTNLANDYLDGIRGADTADRIGPIRAVATGLVQPKTMKLAAVAALGVGFCIGLMLIPFGGWWLPVVGLASVACAWLYSGGPYPLAYHGLGDAFVVLFFGFVAVACTYYVQAGIVTFDGLVLGLGCGLLVNNILLVNNYRDMNEDRRVGKKTLIVHFGRRFALRLHAFSTVISALVVLWFWMRGYGTAVLVSLLPSGYSLLQIRHLKAAQTSLDFLNALRSAGIVVASYGLFFSASLFLD